MIQLSSSNGTLSAIEKITKAWRAMHEAYLTISEINEGSWKQGQEPLCFTCETSPELATAMRGLEEVFGKLTKVSKEGEN